jgi:hypothetical protein
MANSFAFTTQIGDLGISLQWPIVSMDEGRKPGSKNTAYGYLIVATTYFNLITIANIMEDIRINIEHVGYALKRTRRSTLLIDLGVDHSDRRPVSVE